jgi:hypothetical protein
MAIYLCLFLSDDYLSSALNETVSPKKYRNEKWKIGPGGSSTIKIYWDDRFQIVFCAFIIKRRTEPGRANYTAPFLCKD